MKTRNRRGGKRLSYLAAVIVVIIAYAVWALLRPMPGLAATTTIPARTPTVASKLVWPAQGESAVGIVGSPILDTHGVETPEPTASTAKLITALVVLRQKPLEPGEQGPLITLNDSDLAIYNNYIAQDGSLVQVQVGEQISEYQMLQTMMLPSANNMADSLAIWAFGSLQNYAVAANQYLENSGLSNTHVGSDASGLSPTTTSTAPNLVKIGELVMQNPILSQIVGQSSASGIPVVGTIKNVNSLLGIDGVVGIKTGNSDQAGGVFVSAANTIVNNKQVTIVTALMASPTLAQAMKDSLPLITSAQSNFTTATVTQAGQTIVVYKAPWGTATSGQASTTTSLSTWNGTTVMPKITLTKVTPKSRSGSSIGNVTIPASALNNSQSTSVQLASTPTAPSVGWRLTHPF